MLSGLPWSIASTETAAFATFLDKAPILIYLFAGVEGDAEMAGLLNLLKCWAFDLEKHNYCIWEH